MAETRVLIVDDDREITRAIGLRLSNVGFKPIMAYDGQEGLEIVQKNPPDAIILDLRMPVMDGFQLLEKLQNSVHTRNIPAIILSADAADKARLKALRAGATYFVEKPYRAQDLIDALSVTIERRQANALPIEPRERNTMSATAAAPDAPTNRRVLIADDDPAVVRALSVRCKKLGLEVETAENGLQAILKASRNPPRLLILDINMPEADGFRVCEWLLDPQRPPIDVVMLTGRNDSDTLSRCNSFGAFYVPKNQETWDTIKSIMGEILDIDEAALNAAVAAANIQAQRRSAQAREEEQGPDRRGRCRPCARPRAPAEEMRRRHDDRLERRRSLPHGHEGAAGRDHRRLRDAGRRRPLSAVAAEEHRIHEAHPGHHDHRPEVRAGNRALARTRDDGPQRRGEVVPQAARYRRAVQGARAALRDPISAARLTRRHYATTRGRGIAAAFSFQ